MTTQTGTYSMALGAAMMVCALSLSAGADLFSAAMLGISAFGAVLFLSGLGSVAADAAYHARMVVTHVYEARHVGRPAAPSVAATVTVDQEADPRSVMWREYWAAALVYAEQVGALTYRAMREFFGDDVSWRDNLILPLVRAGYCHPVQPRQAVTLADGWTIERIRWRIEAGVGLPPYPAGLPPAKFPGQQAAQTAENSEKTA